MDFRVVFIIKTDFRKICGINFVGNIVSFLSQGVYSNIRVLIANVLLLTKLHRNFIIILLMDFLPQKNNRTIRGILVIILAKI